MQGAPMAYDCASTEATRYSGFAITHPFQKRRPAPALVAPERRLILPAEEVISIGPQPGPQTDYLSSEADIAIYGGAAGG